MTLSGCEEYSTKQFDPSTHVKLLLESSSELASSISTISFHLDSVQKHALSLISSNSSELLLKVRKVDGLCDQYAGEVDSIIRQVVGRFREVEGKVREVRDGVDLKLKQLENSTLVSSYLRKIKDLMTDLREMKMLVVTGGDDRVQAAKSIIHLRSKRVSSSAELQKVKIVVQLWREFEQVSSDFVTRLHESLDVNVRSRGVTSRSEAAGIITALRLLQSDQDIITDFLKPYYSEINELVGGVFDLSTLAKTGVDRDPSLKTAEGSISLASLAKIFWNRMIEVFDRLFELLIVSYSLDALFSSSSSVKSVLSTASGELWNRINTVFRREIGKCCVSTPAIVQIMQGSGYHRLLRLIGDNKNKLKVQLDESSHHHDAIQVSIQTFVSCFSQFESAYLSRSVGRMFEPINSAFGVSSKGAVPTVVECSNIVKLVLAEIDMAKFDDTLHQLVLKNVGKAVNLVTVRCEAMLDTDPQSFNILISPFPAGLVRNLQICNILSTFLQTLNLDVGGELENSYDNADKLFDLFFSKMSRLACRNFEAMLFKMHMDTSSNTTTDSLTNCLGDLEKMLSNVRRDLLQHMNCFFEFNPWLIALLKRIVIVYVTCAALLKPAPPTATIKQQTERLQMLINGTATAFQINLAKMSDSNNLMKALIKISETSLEHIGSHQFKETRNMMIAVHILFSKGPVDLKLPHRSMGMSLDKYVSWIDQHSFDEWKGLMEKALNVYVKEADSRGSKTYAQEYVTILKLLKKL